MNKITSSKTRLAIVFLVIGLLLFISIGAAVRQVAVNQDSYYHKALAEAAGSTQVIVAEPGNILDCNGTYLATSVRVYRLILDPGVLYETEESYPGSVDKTVEIVSEAFDLDADDLKSAFSENQEKNYLRYGGSTILSESQVKAYKDAVSAFEKEKQEYNSGRDSGKITAKVAGIWFEEEYRRTYPQNSLLSKVIGYTTKDATTGLLGLELKYNDLLRGTNGKTVTYVDSDGDVIEDVEEAEDGYNLVTSLDANAAAIIQEKISEFEEEVGANRINVLLMNPKTGEILAMESNTDYDLNNPSDLSGLFTEEELADPASTFLLQEAFKGRTDELEAMTYDEQIEALTQQVQQNYAVSGTFEPGSTAKCFTLAAAIEEGAITQDETFTDDGPIDVDIYTIHCHADKPCGVMTAMEAFGNSCNVCFVQIGNAVGSKLFAKYQEIFNLGQKTGIDLPGEANTSSLIYSEDRLGDIELATCSFGQGFNVTMVQMAAAYASIVNGGYYYQPHVVSKITDNEGNVVQNIEPTLVRRTISEDTADYLKEALEYVTEKGTGIYAATFGYKLGGKTGAAEKLPRGTGKYVVSFVGAAPIDDPELLIYVVVDEPNVEDQSMSQPAQDLAKSILDELYGYYGIYPYYAEDAYEYDWSSLKDFSGEDDSMNGQEFMDDPQNSMEWLEETASEETEDAEEEAPAETVQETSEETSAETIQETPEETPEDTETGQQ